MSWKHEFIEDIRGQSMYSIKESSCFRLCMSLSVRNSKGMYLVRAEIDKKIVMYLILIHIHTYLFIHY